MGLTHLSGILNRLVTITIGEALILYGRSSQRIVILVGSTPCSHLLADESGLLVMSLEKEFSKTGMGE